MRRKTLIRIVDDDAPVRKGLEFMLGSEGYEAKSYESAKEFLENEDPEVPGFLVLDIKMPEMDGIELHEELIKSGYPRPIVFLSGHGDIDIAVRAVKRGAFDFLQKPVDPDRFLEITKEALKVDEMKRKGQLPEKECRELASRLSERELQIIRLLLNSVPNAQIASILNLSVRTVENHRSSAYKKLNVSSQSQLEVKFEAIKNELMKIHPSFNQHH